ncbi:hypothetical protein [Yinghuangia sp. YIM S10712]|uniref:hypothetical protein n=1 Tax=Yinghuangia sp. YIM S10712 TaxID=3436930 RepID=UPI003F53B604
MRKIRKAALVVAMVGSVSVFGASAAFADSDTGVGDAVVGADVVACDQHAEVGDETNQNGLVNLATGPITVLGSGPATSTSIQQACSGGDSVGVNGSAAESGAFGLDLGFGDILGL